MLAIGIDPGIAHAGFAALDADRKLLLVAVFESGKADRTGDTQARLGALMAWAQDQADTARALDTSSRPELFSPDDVFAIEWPVVGGRRGGTERGSGVKAAAQTFAAAGALLGMLRDQCGTLLAPVPITWRCAVAGGRAPTEEVHAQIEHDYGVVAKVGRSMRSHALDAVGLALYAHQHLTLNRRRAEGAALH